MGDKSVRRSETSATSPPVKEAGVTEEEFRQPRPEVNPDLGADSRLMFQPEMQAWPPIDDQTAAPPIDDPGNDI